MNIPQSSYDVIILGAGAAGLMCAIEAGKRGRSVAVLERSEAVGKKIRISGGGRCNFTNLQVDNRAFISNNPHFCKSALARYTPSDFLGLVERHGIRYHEKTLGQLFCDGSAQEIIDMLLQECHAAGMTIVTDCAVKSVTQSDRFRVETSLGEFTAASLVIATGGISLPKIGATDFGYRLARQFRLHLTPVRPGLVPLLWEDRARKKFETLSGISLSAAVSCGGQAFEENILFTHRGLSGPAILQASSYWQPGASIVIDADPNGGITEALFASRSRNLTLANFLADFLPRRFAQLWSELYFDDKPLTQYSNDELHRIAQKLRHWEIQPAGTEGLGKAEVTVGGINTNDLSSKTMEARDVPGLFCIGEVVDVTGWLGGYNFQWAWSSGFIAGQFV